MEKINTFFRYTQKSYLYDVNVMNNKYTIEEEKVRHCLTLEMDKMEERYFNRIR